MVNAQTQHDDDVEQIYRPIERNCYSILNDGKNHHNNVISIANKHILPLRYKNRSIEQMAYKWHVLIVTTRKREKKPQLRMILMRILNWTCKQSTIFSAVYRRCCFGVFGVWKRHIFWIYDNDDGIIHNINEAKMGLAFMRIHLRQFTSSHGSSVFFILLARYIIWNDYVKWHHITIEMHGIYLIKSNSDNATFWEIHHHQQQQQTNDGDGGGTRLSNKSSRKSLCPILCTMYMMSYDLIYGITMKLRNILCLGRSVCFFSVFEASMFIPFSLHFRTNNSLDAVFGIWGGFCLLFFFFNLNESEDRWMTFKWAYFRLRLESNSIDFQRIRFKSAEWIFQL